jgi:hypothetical protein
MASSIQMAAIANAGIVAPGKTPKTRSIPGVAEKPMVRSN